MLEHEIIKNLMNYFTSSTDRSFIFKQEVLLVLKPLEQQKQKKICYWKLFYQN